MQYVSVRAQYIDIYYHIHIHIHIHIDIHIHINIHIHIYGQLHHISVRAQYISVRTQYISIRAHPHHSTPFHMAQNRCLYPTHIERLCFQRSSQMGSVPILASASLTLSQSQTQTLRGNDPKTHGASLQ